MENSNDSIDSDSPNSTQQLDHSPWSLVSSSQKWSPQSLHDRNRKSAFQPYKCSASSASSVLTNLQRGNTQAETLVPSSTDLTFHMKAGQGELNPDDILNETDVDVLDSNNLTALHWSSAYGQYNTVELLIKYNADIDKLGPDEETPLILAASGGHHEVVKLLLQHGADVDHVDHLCNSALMYAAKGNHPHTCQELLLQGADYGLVNLEEDAALSIAMENNSTLGKPVATISDNVSVYLTRDEQLFLNIFLSCLEDLIGVVNLTNIFREVEAFARFTEPSHFILSAGNQVRSKANGTSEEANFWISTWLSLASCVMSQY